MAKKNSLPENHVRESPEKLSRNSQACYDAYFKNAKKYFKEFLIIFKKMNYKIL